MPKIGIFRLFAGINWLFPTPELAFCARPTAEITDENWLRFAILTFTPDFLAGYDILRAPRPRHRLPDGNWVRSVIFHIWCCELSSAPVGPIVSNFDLRYRTQQEHINSENANGKYAQSAAFAPANLNSGAYGGNIMMSLSEARADIDGWLDEVKLKTGKCSQQMRNELAEHMRQRTQSVFSIYDEIGQMEGNDPPRRTGTKCPRPLVGRELSGLMHKHYKTSSLPDFMLNIENHWKRPNNRAERQQIEDEVRQGGHTGKAAHEIVMGGYQARHGARQMTGEWIVYAVIGGVNYYLTLATHKEHDSTIRQRVIGCFAEFPELKAYLGW